MNTQTSNHKGNKQLANNSPHRPPAKHRPEPDHNSGYLQQQVINESNSGSQHGAFDDSSPNHGSPLPTRRHELQSPPKHNQIVPISLKQQVNQQVARQHRVTKSYNLDSMSQLRVADREKHLGIDKRTSKGNIIAFACGPLRKKRYINPKIEVELNDFKKEIEEKFAKSPLRKFHFPLRKPENEKL